MFKSRQVVDKVKSSFYSKLKEITLKYNNLLNNTLIVGFFPMFNTEDGSYLVANIARLLTESSDYMVTLVDFNLKYPQIIYRFAELDIKPDYQGITRLLTSSIAEIKDSIIRTNRDNLNIISENPLLKIEEVDVYIDNYDNYRAMVDLVESRFAEISKFSDIVLILYPSPDNITSFIYVSTIGLLDKGYYLMSYSSSCMTNLLKANNFLMSLGLPVNLINKMIFINDLEIDFDYTVYNEFLKSVFEFNEIRTMNIKDLSTKISQLTSIDILTSLPFDKGVYIADVLNKSVVDECSDKYLEAMMIIIEDFMKSNN